MISTIDILVSADMLEEHGFETCRLLREMAGACEPRPLEPWEVADKTIKSPTENRIDYFCRLFRRCLEKQVDRQGFTGPDAVDQAAFEVVIDGQGNFVGEVSG